MTREEFINLTKALKTFYPRDNMLPNMEAMELWYRELSDISYTVAEAALRKYVATNKFSPTIADIRELSATVTNGDKPLWSDGWEEVLRAIKLFGSYRETEALQSMTETTREAVKRMGFRNICLSENIMTERANFRTIFEQLADRKQKNAQLSTGLAQLISGLQERKEIESSERKRLSVTNPET